MTTKRGYVRALFAAPLILVVAAISGGASGVRNASAIDLSRIDPRLRVHVSGTAALELGAAPAAAAARTQGSFFPSSDDGCSQSRGDNVKVNQNCLNVSDADLQGRGQAQNETAIAIDPNDPSHVVASYNDYRHGDATCGTSFSRDAGRSWADSTAPNGFTRGGAFGGVARQYWQAAGDTSLAWDTRGNAYLSCQVFMRGQPTTNNPDQSSGFVVFRSTGNGGASWNFPGRFVTSNNDVAGAGAVLEDKQYIGVDNRVGSPFRDRIYVTWTEFTATTAFIYEASSADFGETFSPRRLVSTASTLCPFPISTGGGCDNNQGSQPFTGPDGTLYVVWSNFNTIDTTAASVAPARFQVLIAASKDGGATFGAPRRVASYYELPDCQTYQNGQDPGVACVPEKGATANSIFRAANYASGAVNPANPRQVVVSVGSYIGPNSNEANGCVPVSTALSSFGGLYTGVKTAGACKNDILVSASNDGGGTFTGTTADPRTLPTAAPGRRQATTDQWFQWLAFEPDGRVAIAYYDRQYGGDEITGFSDYSLAGSSDLAHFGVRRASSSSSPPPTQFGGTFWGDYAALDVHGQALPLWSDSRSADVFLCPGTATGPGSPPRLCGLRNPNGVANDEDVFTASLTLPNAGDDAASS
jgi:hypothetical protein